MQTDTPHFGVLTITPPDATVVAGIQYSLATQLFDTYFIIFL